MDYGVGEFTIYKKCKSREETLKRVSLYFQLYCAKSKPDKVCQQDRATSAGYLAELVKKERRIEQSLFQKLKHWELNHPICARIICGIMASVLSGLLVNCIWTALTM